MRASRLFTVFAMVSLLGLACSDDDTTGIPSGLEVFTATLNGANERPTPTTTNATGTAVITVMGNLLSWRVDAANISNVNVGHIHFGVADSAGGIMVDLTPTPGSYTTTTTIALGSMVVADSVIVHMRNARAYVNIHTSDGNNTEPAGPAGDYTGGEIRGQTIKQ
jgi:hypothetical protein